MLWRSSWPRRAHRARQSARRQRKIEKTKGEYKENIWIQALKTKTIRTALKFLKTQKSSTSESPKYWQS